MIPYFLMFTCLVIFSLFKGNDRRVLNASMIILGIFCAMRGNNVDRDYETYISIYTYIIEGYSYAIEPTFHLLSIISNTLTGTPFLIFCVYAGLAIYFKIKFIEYWSPYLLLSVLLYFSNVYLLHEMTQIRIGLASAIGFFSLKYLITAEKKQYFIWVFIAMTFHFSMAVFFLLPLLNSKRLSGRYVTIYWISIILLYFLSYYKIDLSVFLKYFDIGIINSKYDLYREQGENNDTSVNIYSAMQYFHLFVIFLSMVYRDSFRYDEKYIIMLKIYSLGPLSLLVFSNVPGFSLRLSELFNVGEIVLLPMLVSHIKQIKLAYLSVILISLCLLLINLYYLSLLKEYSI
ncbi:TPA: O51 family O-antigen polymerase [Escherichia coli]|nr:O51 family O-antigen polymerase [Escherichia coli]